VLHFAVACQRVLHKPRVALGSQPHRACRPCHHVAMNGRKTLERPWQVWHDEEPIRIGVSSCLLGAEVRYDGGHMLDHHISEVLGAFFEWVLVCPEVEIGLGVPRPPIRLVKGHPAPRLVEPESGENLTERMESFARERLAELQEAGLDGFILKSRSPSCGVEGVKVFENNETQVRNGIGIFARALVRRWPNLPVAEDEILEDPGLCGDFFERVLRHHRRRTLARRGLDQQQSAEFHTAHRLLLAHISHDLA
jgi:uncharacterized protein YbbK (DUF523 family)